MIGDDGRSSGALQVLQPAGWPVPRGYANGVAGQGKIVCVGGQIAFNGEGRIPPGFLDQVRQTLRNVVTVLAEADAGPQHVARLTWYVTDIEAYRGSLKELGAIYREIMGKNFPAMALVQVSALVEPEALVEIEATAIVPDGA